jgi:hypothetical protein
MSHQLGFHHIWNRLTGKIKASNVHIVGDRFKLAFLAHGVEVAQIPRLITAISLDDLSTPERLLAVLSPEIIDQTAKLFGIRSQWLEGVDDQIYEYLCCNKEPKELLNHVTKLPYPPGEKRHFPLRVLTTAKHLSNRSDSHQILTPILVEPIAELGDELIYRYHVYRDWFDWNHYPCRLELKAIARTLYVHLGTPVPLFLITAAEMDEVLEGRMIPKRLLRGALITNPSLEDYALSSKESGIARETEELPDVLQYIQDRNLQGFSFDVIDDEMSEYMENEVTDVAVPQENSTPIRNRRPNHAELWEPIRNAAQTLWAQDNKLPIAGVIRMLKGMPTFKASAFTESAIRKNIVDLAPDGVRGKPGRKPKQSSSLMSTLIKHQIDK